MPQTAPAVAESTAPTLRVSGLHFWTSGDATRIAIEIPSGYKLKADRLSNPDRLFFDLIGAKPQTGKKGLQTIPVGDALIKQIRVAETQPGTTRVVFDLESPAVEFISSQLSSPDRLIIELRPSAKQPVTSPLDPSRPLKVFQPPPVRAAGNEPPAPVRIDAVPPKVTARMESPAIPEAKGLPAPAVHEVSFSRETGRETGKDKPRELIEVLKETPAASLPRASAPRMPPATATPAKKTAAGEASLTRVLGLKLGKVVIDAGHGGSDTGTRGPAGLLEKDLVLDVAKRLAALVETRLGSEVILTRSDDVYIPLERRTNMANDNKADLFISVHANSSPIRTTSGVETYYLNFTTSKTALEVAARENASSEKSIYDLKELLQKIALKDKLEESREFAAKVQNAMAVMASKTSVASRDRGVRKAPFVVLIGASMPSILCEIGFVTNARDEALMKRPEHRQKIAEALYRGVSQYASGLSHFQVAQRKTSTE